jgi:hypothetical protein
MPYTNSNNDCYTFDGRDLAMLSPYEASVALFFQIGISFPDLELLQG